MEDEIICRWHYDDIILDVMPTNEKILGFGNIWFKEALDNSVAHNVFTDLIIKSVTAPYFLATKIEAFIERGNNDFFASHDFEDLITVIAGRIEIIAEIAASNNSLKKYLKEKFINFTQDNQFELALPGHVNDGPITMQRVQTVQQRINAIIAIVSE